jgi:hypothetical protein
MPALVGTSFTPSTNVVAYFGIARSKGLDEKSFMFTDFFISLTLEQGIDVKVFTTVLTDGDVKMGTSAEMVYRLVTFLLKILS